MTTKIITKSGTGAPLPTDLERAELAIDMSSNQVYTKNTSDEIVSVGGTYLPSVALNGENYTIFADGVTTSPSFDNINGVTIAHRAASNIAGVSVHIVDTNTYPRNPFVVTNPSGTIGKIEASGNSVSFITTSDYRAKENIVDMTDAVSRLKQLKTHRFNFKGTTNTVDGFLAHEVQPIVPEAVSGTKDAVDDDGKPELQGIDQSKLVPLLVGAVQELTARLEALESK